jgi:hypothetical protein
LNLVAEPRATVQVGEERLGVVAAEVDGTRRDHLWGRFLALYDGLADYQRNAARRIPLVALTPVRAVR